MKSYKTVPFSNVDINMGFWQKRQALNRDVTVRAVMDRFMETGRFEAFKCDWREGMEDKPHIFWDSDIAKWMESVAYMIEKQPMPELERVVEETIDQIEINQDKHGYVNSYFTSVEPGNRWGYRWAHELYCAGHLIEAAVAWREATGRDRFLNVMRRYADYIYRVFVEENSAHFATPGHEEIELALVKLYHATGVKKYLELSRHFVDLRGDNKKDVDPEEYLRQNGDRDGSARRALKEGGAGFTVPMSARYADQSHRPPREQTTAEGHAVRACYYYSAMADIAREYGDEALKAACEKIFDNIVSRRMYLTAGIGSTHNNEAFTIDYDLPNETAYTETCASIALAYFASRMLTLSPDVRYADVIERVIYNGFLSGTSLSGDMFFYTNPMEIDASRRYAHPSSEHGDWLPITQRVKVFGCSCCPPNVTRFVASIGDFMFTEDESTVYLHQFMGADADVSGARIQVETNYPADGLIRIHAENLNGRRLAVRIPGWCEKFELDAPHTLENGYALLEGDTIDAVLTLDMTPYLVEANPAVADAAGKAALMRGPVVYCLEGVDNGEELHDVRLKADTDFAEEPNALYGMPVIRAQGQRRVKPQAEWLYRRYNPQLTERTLTFIPYYAFANRGETDMRVWVPVG